MMTEMFLNGTGRRKALLDTDRSADEQVKSLGGEGDHFVLSVERWDEFPTESVTA